MFFLVNKELNQKVTIFFVKNVKLTAIFMNALVWQDFSGFQRKYSFMESASFNRSDSLWAALKTILPCQFSSPAG